MGAFGIRLGRSPAHRVGGPSCSAPEQCAPFSCSPLPSRRRLPRRPSSPTISRTAPPRGGAHAVPPSSRTRRRRQHRHPQPEDHEPQRRLQRPRARAAGCAVPEHGPTRSGWRCGCFPASRHPARPRPGASALGALNPPGEACKGRVRHHPTKPVRSYAMKRRTAAAARLRIPA